MSTRDSRTKQGGQVAPPGQVEEVTQNNKSTFQIYFYVISVWKFLGVCNTIQYMSIFIIQFTIIESKNSICFHRSWKAKKQCKHKRNIVQLFQTLYSIEKRTKNTAQYAIIFYFRFLIKCWGREEEKKSALMFKSVDFNLMHCFC